uniref:thioesterase II family protein n=1 Tax=Salmonella enterica TaxID=28901 RepID=UPI003A8D1F38
MDNNLFPYLNRCSTPHCEILCFPHAGGSASYFQRWADALPEGFSLRALQLPLREERLDAKPVFDIKTLIAELLRLLPHSSRLPRVLFGHSMGAILAWELAIALQQRGDPPQQIFVSGQTPPDIWNPTDFHLASDQQLIDEVARFSATPLTLFDFSEMREIVLKQLRHDYALIERWQPTSTCTLLSPLTALHGDNDSEVTKDEALGWARFTCARFQLFHWPGDHFYLVNHWPKVVQLIIQKYTGISFDMP